MEAYAANEAYCGMKGQASDGILEEIQEKQEKKERDIIGMVGTKRKK